MTHHTGGDELKNKMLKTLLGTALLALAGAANASAYPEAPITMIVPFAAGGPTDVIARVIGKGLQDQLGQSVVVENKSGAGGRLGVSQLKTAKPDGYTVGVATASTQGVAPNIYSKLNYDPLTDYRAVGQIVVAPGVLVANKEAVPDCKMQTFLDLLKASPGSRSFGSAGIGALSHMSGEQFLAVTRTEMLHVPYKGLGPAMSDLYGGRIDALFDNVSSAMSHIQGGKVCALAVQSEKRLAALPDVPTYAELGLAELNTPTWYGVLVPAGTPDDVVKKLNTALNAALGTPAIKESFDRLGVQPAPVSPEEFARVQEREVALWRDIVAKANLKKLDN